MDYTIQKSEQHTRQSSLLVTKGTIAIIWGVAALISSYFIPMLLVVSFGVLNFVAAALTLIYAYNNRHLEIAHQWLLLEGLVEIVAGFVFTFVVKDVPQFISYMSFGIVFIITLQFIYGYALILKGRFSPQNMMMRFASVAAGTIISVALMANVFSAGVSLIVVGLFSILYGALNMQFATKLRNVIMGPAK